VLYVIPAKAGIQFCLAPLLATGAFLLPLATGGFLLPPSALRHPERA